MSVSFLEGNPEHPERKSSEKGNREILNALVLSIKAEGDEFDNKILQHVNLAMREELSLSDEMLAHHLLSSIYANRKKFKEAEAEVKKTLELNERAVDKLDIMLYQTAYSRLAAIYYLTDHQDEAIKCLQKLVETLPIMYKKDEGEGLEGMLALSYCELAEYYYTAFEVEWGIERVSDYLQKAIKSAQNAIEANPKYSKPYRILGEIYGTKTFGSEKVHGLHNQFYDPVEADKNFTRYLADESITEQDRERVYKMIKIQQKLKNAI